MHYLPRVRTHRAGAGGWRQVRRSVPAPDAFAPAIADGSAARGSRTVIATPFAPKAIGPYSQGILITLLSGERIIHAAGQIGIDPRTGKLVSGGISVEAVQVMHNVEAVIMAVPGATLHDITDCTVLMANLTEYAEFNSIYAHFFDSEEAPARAAVEVAKLPLDARVEVKCSAAAGPLALAATADDNVLTGPASRPPIPPSTAARVSAV